MVKVVICLGSNMVPCETRVRDAVARLGDVLIICSYSEGYFTPSHNGIGADYYNLVMICETDMTYDALYMYTKQVEGAMGRTAISASDGCMPIDIDIVLYDGDIMKQDDYARPHFRLGYEMLVGKIV